MSQTMKELAELMAHLPEDVQRHIFQLAKAEAVRFAHTANGKHSFLDTARQLGVVGIAKNGPSDLSVNPDHMEGFGR